MPRIGSVHALWPCLRTVVTLVLLGFATALALGPRISSDPVAPQDEGLLLTFPDLVLRGYVPYEDFSSVYGPAGIYIIAAVFCVFGKTVLVERLVGLVYQYVIVAICYALGKEVSWLTGFLAAITSLAMIVLFPISGAYSMFGALVFTLVALYCAHRSCSERERAGPADLLAIAAGALSGLIFWFRPEVGALGTVSALIALDPTKIHQLKRFLIGLLPPICAGGVFVLAIGPTQVFDSVILDPLRNGPGRTLPLQLSPLFFVLCASVSINVILGFVVNNKRYATSLVWLVRAIAILSAGLAPLALQRADVWHLTYTGAAVVALSVVSLGVIFSKHAALWPRSQVVCVLLSIVCLVAINLTTTTKSYRALTGQFSLNGRSVPAMHFEGHDDSPDQLNGLLRDIDRASRTGERLFVGPADLRFSNYNDTFIYFLLPKLTPASRYLEMGPGQANRQSSGLAEEIASADWLILTTRYELWNEPNASMEAGSAMPNEIVRLRFCRLADYGAWRLLRRCQASS